MSVRFQTVGVISKYRDPEIGETLSNLLTYLEGKGCQVLLDESACGTLPDSPHRPMSREVLAERCDLVVAVGGDGTLLNAARSMTDAGVPILGINRGRLGFLADVLPAEMTQQLDHILAGDYELEERSLLHAQVFRDGKTVMASDALNDVVIHKWDIARMIELETSIRGRFLNTQRSDGLIISTPTGSTAYALSGGGPILHPTLDAIAIVPICPHTLSNRPIVVNGHAEIEVILHGHDETEAQVTCDGQVKFRLVVGDRICVERKDKALKLIHPPGHDHYQVLRAKLRWG